MTRHLGATVGLLCALASASCGGSGTIEGPAAEAHPLVGAAAPGFDLTAQSGGDRANLESARGKIVIVDFWATWCEPCRKSFPKYQEMARRHSERLQIYGISEDDEPDGIAAFATETGVTFPLAWDRGKAIARAYRPKSMPTSYVIDRDGIVRYVHTGFHEGDERIIETQVRGLMEP